ncbi:MAG: flagellin FliC [bacterium]|nr:flagellin FliC [bacterium]
MGIGLEIAARTSPMERTQNALHKTFSQLSSLKRVNSASDDASALARSENLRAFERALAQGERNLNDGVSLTQTAESGLGQIGEQLSRLRELSVQAGSPVLDDTGRAALQSEADAITSEITRLSKATQFNGQGLLTGELSGSNAVTLRDGSAEGAIQLSIADSSADALGLAGFDVTDPASLENIDSAMTSINSSRAELGAFGNRLESGIHNLQAQRENTAAANSRLVDADVAKATAELAKNQVQQEFQIAVSAQANILSGAALHLLR